MLETRKNLEFHASIENFLSEAESAQQDFEASSSELQKYFLNRLERSLHSSKKTIPHTQITYNHPFYLQYSQQLPASEIEKDYFKIVGNNSV